MRAAPTGRVAAAYQCECLDCGYRMESEKHCRDVKCPECGGTMRRVERPGPGQKAVVRDSARSVAVAKEDGTLEITIYDLIGHVWDDSGVTAKEISKILADHKDAARIVVYINSAGGDVFEGITIYNQLARHKARVEVNVDGMALSIASLVVMGSSEPG